MADRARLEGDRVAALLGDVARRAGLDDLVVVPTARSAPARPHAVLQRRPAPPGSAEALRHRAHLVPGAPGAPALPEGRRDPDVEGFLVHDGRSVRLWASGEPVGPAAPLPRTAAAAGPELVALLRRCLAVRAAPVATLGELARRLATRTADLRDALAGHLDPSSPAGTRAERADGLAQVVGHGRVLAALDGAPDPAAEVLGPALAEALRPELARLATLVEALDLAALSASPDPRGDPWLYFYEDFLGVYDPEARRRAGVYFTPTAVVEVMVAMVDHLLVERLGRSAGFADPTVLTLDPAVGTGTFPLAVVDRAARRQASAHGPAGVRAAAARLAANLRGIELNPGPFAAAHLRVTARLRALDPGAGHGARLELGDALAIAREPGPRVTVVLGNPPYRRLARDAGGRDVGAWMFAPRRSAADPANPAGGAPFADLLDVAREHTIFSHHASLYNLYVYFWRWALWTVFEAHGPGDGIVAFVTASSWLTGPGFVGLRQLVRDTCEEVWVLDLGGDLKGAVPDGNVFAIETPVAIAILVRTVAHDPGRPARIRYRRVTGTAAEKLALLRASSRAADPLAGPWEDAPTGPRDRLVPATGGDLWGTYPALADLLPWQQPGCKYGRTWPISPDPEVLRARWARLVGAPVEERPALFRATPHGRDPFTAVGGRAPLVEEPADAPPPPIVRYGYRSFDRQWALADPRLAALERPSLWRSASDRQVYLATMITKPVGPGPALTCTPHVPDLDVFCGRGGKDILPLYRDAGARQANVTSGLLAAIAAACGARVDAEDLAAYVYALLSTPGYQARFAEALRTPGPRVPLTAERPLWDEAVTLGRELLHVHTWGERFGDGGGGRPAVAGLGWRRPVTRPPRSPAEVRYDPRSAALTVGDGIVDGVLPDVWGYTVGRMPVVRKWLGYRTLRGAGRAPRSTSRLDAIRSPGWPEAWSEELLDLLGILAHSVARRPAQDDLLARICAGVTLPAQALPTPTPEERSPPGGRALA